MSKLYYRLNSLCAYLNKRNWLILMIYHISNLRLMKKSYHMIIIHYGWKFENDNKIFEKYRDCFILLDETLDKTFTDKYKSFIDEYEEEYEKIKNELKTLKKTGWKIL